MAEICLGCGLGLKLLRDCFVMVSVDNVTRSVIWEQLAPPTVKVMRRSLPAALHYTLPSILEMFGNWSGEISIYTQCSRTSSSGEYCYH